MQSPSSSSTTAKAGAGTNAGAKAVILLSGGLDSATALAVATSRGYACYALSFDYQQNNRAEIQAAKKVAQHFQVVEHKILSLPFAEIKGSALTDTNIAVPDYRDSAAIPVTYVPARNTIFLSFALSWAEVLGAQAIFIGACAIDYSGYPDCRPDYIAAYQTMANLSNKCGVEDGDPIQIIAPLLALSKAQIITTGVALGVDYRLTISCYRATADLQSCGTCDSCHYRKKGFAEAGIADPTQYIVK